MRRKGTISAAENVYKKKKNEENYKFRCNERWKVSVEALFLCALCRIMNKNS
jgi:hypothetical protein